MPEEIWLPVVGYEGHYEISSEGRLKTLNRNRLMSLQQDQKTGYLRVGLWKGGKYNRFSVHRLVAYAFHGAPVEPRVQVAHNDGSRTNNKASNLRWATAKENHADIKIHGTKNAPKGESHGMAKLTDDDISKIREDRRFQDDIAKEYCVSQSLISHIKTRKSWTHIN